jgi:hypothetical protein
MNSYRYKITVEALTGAKGEPVEGRTLSFEAANHDDILGIVERMRSDPMFATIDPASGLKQGPTGKLVAGPGRLL